jgi:hypothetical protein
MVSLEDNLCRNCGEKFQEHPEIRAKKWEMHAEIKRNAGEIISIVTIVVSLVLLIITLMLDNLHRWIMPIEQDGGVYLIPMILGILLALGLIIRNMKIRVPLKESSTARMITPYAILTISCIGMTLILFAGEVDRFLTLSESSLLPALAAACVFGVILLAISKGLYHRNKKRDSWVERS